MINNPNHKTILLSACCCLIAALCGCSGYTLEGRLATRDEAIVFFEKNKRDFEDLRDVLLTEEASKIIIYETGDCSILDGSDKRPSQAHLQDYVARLKRLGLPNASKTYADDPRTPIVDFGLSAVGLVGNSHSITLIFTKGQPGVADGAPVKIEKSGWYLSSD